jgi:hypothetical protein
VLNAKTYLLELAKEGLVLLPPTSVLSQSELVSGDIPDFQTPHFLKHNFGSGGGGNFLLKDSKDSILTFLQRRLKPDSNPSWLLQKKIPMDFEGCVFGDTSSSLPPYICEVRYDEHGLSYRHDFSSKFDAKSEVLITYLRLQTELNRRGYEGPCGLDFLQSTEDQKCYFVDLNLRWTKTHLLVRALSKLGLSESEVVSLRFRWKSPHQLTFDNWWGQLKQHLQLNLRGENTKGQVVCPYLVSGLEGAGLQKEISVFVSKSSDLEGQIGKFLQERSQ